jgi:nucleotide-binding universal stress UspA family protein
MYDSILIPTDGSEHAELAARHGLGLAERFDAAVHVVGVVDVSAAAGPFNAGGVDDAFVDRLKDQARSAVDAVEALADPSGDGSLTSAVVRGEPGEAIVEYIDEAGIDVVAMGTRGQRGLRRFVTGSVTEDVVRHAHVPVVTVRTTDAAPVTDYERILVTTDGSSAAEAAIDHAVAVADAYDATLHVCSIVDISAAAAGPSAAPPMDLLANLREQGAMATERVAERARAGGVDVVTEVREGFPGPGVLDYADDADIDLIAMGTHGRTGVDRLLLGSTTERTIRRAKVPVMSVHPESE